MFQAAQQLTAQERLTTRTDEDLMSKAVGMRLAVLVVTNSDVVKSMSVMEASLAINTGVLGLCLAFSEYKEVQIICRALICISGGTSCLEHYNIYVIDARSLSIQM